MMTIAELESVQRICEAENITLKRFIEQWRLAQQIQVESPRPPRSSLIRVLNSFHSGGWSRRLMELRGLVFEAVIDENGVACFNLTPAHPEDKFVALEEYELVDSSMVRVGDRVRVRNPRESGELVGEVIELGHNSLGVKHHLGSNFFIRESCVLVPSNTKLG